jgi:monovalent cation:H+ antiporter-2, CPA2 family
LPIQSLFLMVFFLSVGLLIDLGFIWDNLGKVILWLIVVTLFKTALNIGVLRLLGNPWDRSFLSGVVMGQIGEFSFVLVATAVSLGLMPEDRHRLAVAVIALSLMVSPLWLATARRLVPIMALSITSFREIVRLLLGQETLEMAARGRLAALQAAKATADKLKAMRGNGNGTVAAMPTAQAAGAAAVASTAASSTPLSPEPSTTNSPSDAPLSDPSLPANENRSKTGSQ